jgi:hypothetical protein
MQTCRRITTVPTNREDSFVGWSFDAISAEPDNCLAAGTDAVQGFYAVLRFEKEPSKFMSLLELAATPRQRSFRSARNGKRVCRHPHHMVDRRRIARTRISAPALVIPNRGSMVWRCRVCDITSLGARLEFPAAPVLPTDFNLTFDAKTLRWCRLKWRIANEVGVSFQFPTKT